MSGMFIDVAYLRADTDGEERPRARTPVPVTVFEPEGHSRGGIVLLHESREFTGTLLEFMRSLSSEGWTVVAPDLFHRTRSADCPTAEKEVFGQDLFDDFDASFDWLTTHGVFPDCIGVLGFDHAGTAAFLVATNRPVGAAVTVAAPGIAEPLTDEAAALVQAAPDLQAPWLGLYGADDPETPADDIEKLRDAAARAAVASLVITYPGLRHRADSGQATATAPDDDDDDDDFTTDSQTRVFDWFDSNLR